MTSTNRDEERHDSEELAELKQALQELASFLGDDALLQVQQEEITKFLQTHVFPKHANEEDKKRAARRLLLDLISDEGLKISKKVCGQVYLAFFPTHPEVLTTYLRNAGALFSHNQSCLRDSAASSEE